MSPIVNSSFYKTRDQILLEMIAAMQGAVPDVYVGDDGIVFILFQVEAAQFENAFLANQILLQECFPQTASGAALRLFGQMFNVPQLVGQPAIGQVTFHGVDGVAIPSGSIVGAPRAPGLDPLLFATTADTQIPTTGVPTAPTAVLNVAAGNLNGSYEYAVTFVTASGETLQSPDSVAVTPVNQKADLSAIPIGGADVTKRKLYRQKNGTGPYSLVVQINDNTTTTYTDNIADGSVGAAAPTVDTAHDITVNATAQKTGASGNVSVGTISLLVNVSAGITTVINAAAFTDGSDDEEIEAYRQRLLERIGDPNTGSVADLKSWAESIQGVEQATVFNNDNLGVATNGHVTVRIAGPAGAIPDAGVIAAVLALLQSYDIANITIHVATFTQVVKNVTCDVTTDATHTLGDVTPSVQQAVTDYIEGVPVGGVLYISGIVDSIYGLPGIVDVTVSVPGSNQTAAATEKFIAGTITVT